MTAKPQPSVKYAGLTSLPDPPKRPDAMRQRPHVARADQVLRASYHLRPDVLVSGEGYLCYHARDARTSPHPDCLVAFGLEIPGDVIEELTNGYVISELGRPRTSCWKWRRQALAGGITWKSGRFTPAWGWGNTGVLTPAAGVITMPRWLGTGWGTTRTALSRWSLAPMASCVDTARRLGWACTGAIGICNSGTRLRETTCPTSSSCSMPAVRRKPAPPAPSGASGNLKQN